MKLTKETLKRIIKEELENVLNETRVAPTPPEGISPDQLDKIHELIMSKDPENMNMAQSLIDAFGGDPNYADRFYRYETTGDLEKLGNKYADLRDYYTYEADPTGRIYRGYKQGLDPREAEAKARAIDMEAEELIDKKFERDFPDGEMRHHRDRELDPLYGYRGSSKSQIEKRYSQNRTPEDERLPRDTFLTRPKINPVVRKK